MAEERFPLGRTVATPGALNALNTNHQTPLEFFILAPWKGTGGI